MVRGSAAAALLIDLVFGEPPAPIHPVRCMGWGIDLARRARRGSDPLASVIGGSVLALGGVGFVGLAALALQRGLVRRSASAMAWGAALKPALALRALLAAGVEVEGALRRDDLEAARHALGWHLVSRDVSDLSASEVAGAAIESLAENLSDGFVAPLLAFRVAGLPAAYGYRFVNTCDAMLGYRTRELEWFGKPSARLDDALNWGPARISAALIGAAADLGGMDGGAALRVARRDGRSCASPNAGWPMAAMAGALEVRLTKRGAYELNGNDRAPDAGDLARARGIVLLAALLATLMVEL